MGKLRPTYRKTRTKNELYPSTECDLVVVEPFNPGEEQEFKTECIRCRRLQEPNVTIFEVENEEKEPGFPDTLEIRYFDSAAELIEYKVSDDKGNIKFERDQPLFYVRNRHLPIKVIAYCVPDKRVYIFDAEPIAAAVQRRISAGYKTRSVNIVGGKITQ